MAITIDHDEYNTIWQMLNIVKETIAQKRDTSERWSKAFDCEVDIMLRGVDLIDRIESELAREE